MYMKGHRWEAYKKTIERDNVISKARIHAADPSTLVTIFTEEWIAQQQWSVSPAALSRARIRFGFTITFASTARITLR